MDTTAVYERGLEIPILGIRRWCAVCLFATGAEVLGMTGEEMFTLALPDNKVVSKVLQTDWFTERLFTPWKHYPELKRRRVPPVTILSHSDIGIF
jgi:hypothetical protein